MEHQFALQPPQLGNLDRLMDQPKRRMKPPESVREGRAAAAGRATQIVAMQLKQGHAHHPRPGADSRAK